MNSDEEDDEDENDRDHSELIVCLLNNIKIKELYCIVIYKVGSSSESNSTISSRIQLPDSSL